MSVARTTTAALAGVGLILLAGCTSTSTSSPTASAADGPLTVVASTNVWGDIAAQVGGDLVTVTSIISDPSADPHSYEANAQVQLSLSKADLVIENGGGYDDFVDTMLSALDTTPTVINAVDVSGKEAPADGELNEHVWYDFPTVISVADAIAADLGETDPAHADDFTANAKAFTDAVDELSARADDLSATVGGKGVAITEPVPGYLLDACGLVNKTPEEFSEAIEEETDVPADVMAQTLALFSDHQVDALVYNSQTTGPQTEQVLDAATAAGVAVVPVTETMPEGDDYQTWMGANLDALTAALS